AMLIGRRPPLIQEIPRGPGQREERYVHLLSGTPQIAPIAMQAASAASSASGLEERVSALEEEIAMLRARIDALTGER
ncbi:DUF480 domain-containing protein, partial [Mesorhizobium sp. M7A.F.Ca.CA.001.06.1.1]